jgi:hypothetical protein
MLIKREEREDFWQLTHEPLLVSFLFSYPLVNNVRQEEE